MKRTHLVAGASIAAFLAIVLLFALRPLGDDFYIIADILVVVLALLAVVSGFYAFRMHGHKSFQGKALLFVTLGSVFWLLGEFTWGFYEVVLGMETPTPSIADIFWYMGYPLFLMGLYYIYKVSTAPMTRRTLAILTVLAVFICAVLLWLSAPNLTDPETSLEEKIATGGYVIGDMLELVAIVFVIACLLKGRFLKVWVMILMAIVVSTMGDIYYMNFSEIYEVGNVIDILWDLDYMLFAVGFFYHRETVKGIFSAAKDGKAKEAKK